MNPMIKSTMVPLPLQDGETVMLTLNFSRLLKVRATNKNIYDRYNKAISGEEKDIVQSQLTMIYTAYLCGYEGENPITESEFVELIPPYQNVINDIIEDLMQPKKDKASE